MMGQPFTLLCPSLGNTVSPLRLSCPTWFPQWFSTSCNLKNNCSKDGKVTGRVRNKSKAMYTWSTTDSSLVSEIDPICWKTLWRRVSIICGVSFTRSMRRSPAALIFKFRYFPSQCRWGGGLLVKNLVRGSPGAAATAETNSLHRTQRGNFKVFYTFREAYLLKKNLDQKLYLVEDYDLVEYCDVRMC